MRRLPPILLLLAALALPAGASAQECIAPPGTAAVDEYCETVPDAAGDRGSPAPPQRVSPGTLSALREQGEDGARLADQLDREVLAQNPNRRSDRDLPASKDAVGVLGQSEPGSNPLDAVREAVGAGATVEDGLGWALAIITLALAGTAWFVTRRRRA